MDSGCETTNGQIRSRLAYRNGFLCVLGECGSTEGQEPTMAQLWYPVRAAEEAEVKTLLGRPLTEVDAKEGIYVDEEGTVFQLAEKGETKPMVVEEIPGEGGELVELLAASLKNGDSSGQPRTHALRRPTGRRRKNGVREANGFTKPGTDQPCGGVVRDQPALPTNPRVSQQPSRPRPVEPAAAAGRGPADPGGARRGGGREPAVGQRSGTGRQPHRPQGHCPAAGRCAEPGRAGARAVRRGGPGKAPAARCWRPGRS